VIGVLIHSKGVNNQGVKKILEICKQKNIDVFEDDRLVDKLSPRGNTYTIGIFNKYQENLDISNNHVVLVQPVSMGNLGTIMRSMIGFGKYDLALIEPTADPFDPKVVRASMGAVFQLRIQIFRDIDDYRNTLENYNFYPLMTDGKHLLQDTIFRSPYAIIFGAETSGLSEEFNQLGTSIRIPQNKMIDSLNLGVSVSVTLYQCYLNELNREE
jgi:TrmH family RNA methyltransferase